MGIIELCQLTKEYESNILTTKIKKSDLEFYTQQWKKDALNSEIDALMKRQIEIQRIIQKVVPLINF